MLGHPGPRGRRCGDHYVRLVLVLDVLAPDDIPLGWLQHHVLRCIELALSIAGTHGERVGCAIARAPDGPKNWPL